MIEISLTVDEWLYAAGVGCKRQIDGAMKKRHPGHGSPEKRTNDGWFWNVNGAAGEKCVAKWLGVPWDGSFGDLKADDVEFLQVRATPGHNNALRLHHEDADEKVFIQVTGIGPTWRIQGFILARRGKREEWFHDRPPPVCKPTGRPAFWVPQEHLNLNLDRLRSRVLSAIERQRVA